MSSNALRKLTLILLSTLYLSACNSSQPTGSETTVDQRVQQALDVQQIQNVMSRHAWYYSSGQHERELNELFALDMPDVSWGNGREWWVGKELLTEYYVTFFDTFRMRDLKAFAAAHPEVEISPDNLGAGTSMFHTNSTPVIEIAGDGKTAKGIWYSIGQVTQTPGGRQTPTYMWERYGVDFIRVNGEWKIWHFLVLTDWAAAPGKSWAADDGAAPFGPPPQAGGDDIDGFGSAAAQFGAQAGESGAAPLPNVTLAVEPPAPFAPPSETLFVPAPYATFSETVSYGPPAQ